MVLTFVVVDLLPSSIRELLTMAKAAGLLPGGICAMVIVATLIYMLRGLMQTGAFSGAALEFPSI